jgi:uncharacterized protein (TIGR02246 family)
MSKLAWTVVVALGAFAASPASVQADSPRSVIEAAFAAINRHDAASLARLYTKDAVIIDSGVCAPEIGAAIVRKSHEQLFAAMPDVRAEIRDWVVQGDQVAILFTAYGKGFGPSGQLTMADFFTVRNGRITRDVTIYNPGKPCA